MWKRKLLLGALATASIGVMPLPSLADTGIFVDIAPPAPRYEVVPSPRAGYAWVPGFWDWRGRRHVWVKGHFERERAGFVYAPNHWVEEGGRWRLDRGHWDRHVASNERDRDHDGVPNRFDRAPDNPNRR
ncbi:MAG TPA: YXWGXW repeat-containing protein [Usitatibacter sp.]|nr:YXWGXW repeat-containing protein [Usitatibacter sp.]